MRSAYPYQTMYLASDFEATSTTDLLVKVQGDASPGQSGSPHFFCPSGPDPEVCAGGEKGEIVMVHSGYTSVINRIGGPRVASFEGVATLIIQAN